MTNITLAIDGDVLKAARAYAKSRGITLNALVRQQLIHAIEQDKRQMKARKALLELAEKSTARMGPDFKFNREELYDRPSLSGHQHSDLRGSRKK